MKENPYESGDAKPKGSGGWLRQVEDRIIGELTDHERAVLRHGAVWFFLVLFGYYTLRPIREQISATYGIKNLAWLFRATFCSMLVAIPTYSALVSRFHRKRLVPSIYAFFVLCLIGFWAAMRYVPESAMWGATPVREWIARILFIWISVYGLFIVSFFWSVVGDMLSTDQGRRLFGFVFGGGTAGGLIASLVVTFMVERLGQANLLLIPAGLLCLALVIYFSLERSHNRLAPAADLAGSRGRATGGNPFAGFYAVFGSRYLFAICIYGLLLAVCGTTIYFQQSEIVDSAYDVSGQIQTLRENSASVSEAELAASIEQLKSEASDRKTSFFAQVNFWVQVLTLILQTAVVGRLMKHLGLGLTLALLPLAYVLGISSLAIAPTLVVLGIISVTGRSAEYAIANPAREVLFTSVNREDRYKSKSFIDTIVRRGGDTGVGSLYRWLRAPHPDGLALPMPMLSWAVVPIALCWAGLGLFIGRENKRVVAEVESVSDSETSADGA